MALRLVTTITREMGAKEPCLCHAGYHRHC